MKRICLIVFCALLFCLLFTSCGESLAPITEGAAPETETKDTVPVTSKTQRKVSDPLTWKKLEAIPKANASMTTDELRRIVLDFAELSLSFMWTPNADFFVENHDKTYCADALYAGIPYNGYSGNPYKWLLYYDEETGVLDSARVPGGAQTLLSDCSSFAYSAWAKVSNSLTWSVTPQITLGSGILKIGEYQMPPDVVNYKNQKIYTTGICEQNGQQVMYRSYEKLLPADGMVNYLPEGGHVIIVREVKTVRNASGIDGDESYVILLDQRGVISNKETQDGTPYVAQAGIDRKLSFRALYEKGYLPFGVPELYGLDPVEAETADSSLTKDSVTAEELCEASVRSNYPILTVHVAVQDSEGNNLYRADTHISDHTMPYMEYALSNRLYRNVLNRYAGDGRRVTVHVRVSTGEMLLAYEGNLR